MKELLSLSSDTPVQLWLGIFASVKHGGLSLSATKYANRPAHRTQVPDFTVSYVLAKCCHYLHSTVIVFKSVAF